MLHFRQHLRLILQHAVVARSKQALRRWRLNRKLIDSCARQKQDTPPALPNRLGGVYGVLKMTGRAFRKRVRLLSMASAHGFSMSLLPRQHTLHNIVSQEGS